MRFSKLFVVFGIILVTGCAGLMGRAPTHEDPFAMPVDEYMQEHAELRSNLQEGEPRELDEDEWEKFDTISAELVRLVGDATSVEEIGEGDRRRLYELRTNMDQLVVGEVNSRRACSRPPATGSRLRSSDRC